MTTKTRLITGNTYPVKEQIKALGGHDPRIRWNYSAQGWSVPEELADAAQAIVDAAGPAVARPKPRAERYRRSGSWTARFSSGAEIYQNRNGRCEDAPCCGCCS